MIRAIVLDTNQLSKKTLVSLIDQYFEGRIKISYGSYLNLEDKILFDEPYDLAFVSVSCNGSKNKVEQLHIKDTRIVFTTSFDPFVLETLNYMKMEYLVQPYNAAELKRILDGVKGKRVSNGDYEKRLSNCIELFSNDFQLPLHCSEGSYSIKPDRIIRMEAESNYTRIFFTDKKPLYVAKTLGEFEVMLQSHGFIRTHRTHLVNRMYIVSIINDEALLLKDSSKVKISRRRKDEVLRSLSDQLIKNPT
jgi:two-component system LytT family response regulator